MEIFLPGEGEMDTSRSSTVLLWTYTSVISRVNFVILEMGAASLSWIICVNLCTAAEATRISTKTPAGFWCQSFLPHHLHRSEQPACFSSAALARTLLFGRRTSTQISFYPLVRYECSLVEFFRCQSVLTAPPSLKLLIYVLLAPSYPSCGRFGGMQLGTVRWQWVSAISCMDGRTLSDRCFVHVSSALPRFPRQFQKTGMGPPPVSSSSSK